MASFVFYKALGIKYSVFEAIENIFKIPKKEKNSLLINLWTHQSLSVYALDIDYVYGLRALVLQFHRRLYHLFEPIIASPSWDL